ncbi:MAG TPA: hypothetical protein VLB76_08680 [Thermoanaerobaculia bacterium]|jgi:CheY-like chemotaxis protein|nr:hypothetical protein [Thermoanaerobaculia bacterium]
MASYIPALIALSGVAITLLYNFMVQSRDRRIALRKEVYLQAAEAMAGFQEYLANFADANIPQDKHKEMLKGAAAAVNKIHVAGEIETIRRFEAAGQFFAEQLQKLQRSRFQLILHDMKMSNLTDYIERVEKALSGLQTMMQGLQREEPTEENVRQWHGTMELYQRGEGRLNELIDERSRLIDERLRLQLALVNGALSASTEFRVYLAQANLALRNELKLSLSESEYMGIIDRGLQRLRRSFEEFTRGLEEDAGIREE